MSNNKKQKTIASIIMVVLVVIAASILVSGFGVDNSPNSPPNTEQSDDTVSSGETNNNSNDKEDTHINYTSISMSEAQKRFNVDTNYIILDVRRPDEFATGHIPGAINLANENIDENSVSILSDKNQLIFVYCRSGRRSKEASQKLVDLGYTNIVEIGGILDWTGEIEY